MMQIQKTSIKTRSGDALAKISSALNLLLVGSTCIVTRRWRFKKFSDRLADFNTQTLLPSSSRLSLVADFHSALVNSFLNYCGISHKCRPQPIARWLPARWLPARWLPVIWRHFQNYRLASFHTKPVIFRVYPPWLIYTTHPRVHFFIVSLPT